MKTQFLTKGPLEAALAVLRFSPITLMKDAYIPRIQDSFRKNGLPYFEQANHTNPTGELELQWRFFDVENTELVIISDTSFAYQTFSYTHYASFKQRMMILLDLFFKTTEFFSGTILNFLGLRYINAIESEDWRKYLTASFHGIKLPEKLKTKGTADEYHGLFVQGVTELDNEKNAHIIVKTIQNKEGHRFPTDILLPGGQETREGVVTTILDIDHFAMFKVQPADSTLIQDTFDQLHDGCELVFFDAISDFALEEWK